MPTQKNRCRVCLGYSRKAWCRVCKAAGKAITAAINADFETIDEAESAERQFRERALIHRRRVSVIREMGR